MSAAPTLAWDHLHLNAPDAAEAAAWYTEHLGALAAPGDPAAHVQVAGLEVARIGTHEFRWFSNTTPGSVGSVIDHYGWSVESTDDGCAALQAAGAKVLEAPKTVADRLRICFLEDPFGAKLELLEDPDHRGFHHVHLLVPDVETHRQWMASVVGGELATYQDLLPGIRRDGMWLLYRPGGDLAPSLGRAIDHFGFRTEDLEGGLARLEAAGAAMEGPPREIPGFRIGFGIAPDGVRVELVEPT